MFVRYAKRNCTFFFHESEWTFWHFPKWNIAPCVLRLFATPIQPWMVFPRVLLSPSRVFLAFVHRRHCFLYRRAAPSGAEPKYWILSAPFLSLSGLMWDATGLSRGRRQSLRSDTNSFCILFFFNPFETSNKLVPSSYISLQTENQRFSSVHEMYVYSARVRTYFLEFGFIALKIIKNQEYPAQNILELNYLVSIFFYWYLLWIFTVHVFIFLFFRI